MIKKKLKVDENAVRWLFRQIYAFLPRLFIIIILNSVVIFANIYLAVVTKDLIDAAASLVSPAQAAAGSGGFKEIISQIPEVLARQPDILTNIILYLSIILINIVISLVSAFLAVYLNERFEFYIRNKMFSNILKSKWREITEYHSEDLMVRLTSDVHAVASGLINTCTSIVVLVVSLVAAFGTLMYYDPMIALFAFALGPIAVYLSIYFGRKIKYYQTKVQESEAKYRSFMQESIANVTVVKSFSAEDLMSERLYHLYKDCARS
jgi:ABC-type multidrug transport system fused ATPase/permease subunit